MIECPTFSIGRLNILEIINKFSPNGGVNIPIARFTVKTIPKCIKLIPNDSAMGATTGAIIRTAETGSKKHPIINNMKFNRIKNENGLRPLKAIFIISGT